MSNTSSISNMVKRTDENFLLNIARRLHKAEHNLDFLYSCERLRVLPQFTYMTGKIVKNSKTFPRSYY